METEILEKMSYEAPSVEIIEIEVEKGFAESGDMDPGDPSGGGMGEED
jgi:hypothetical protein